MKVLFAIRDDNNIVDSIARKYQRDYNKKLLYKEVKNFTAILRELQQNNSYDRIVISDDIDEKINKSENKSKLILSRLNSIRKAAINKNNKSIPIIFISNNDKIKKQLFDLNIYNGILGEDKIKRKIYELMQVPRNSKKAKEYYHIQETQKAQSVQRTVSQSVNKQSDEKSEVEKVIKYLNQTGLSDEKYVKKFERAYSTLSKSDLDIIIKSLSASTKKILSNNSTRYNKIADTKKANKALNSKKTVNNEVTETTEETTTKRGRGRPRKQPKEDELEQEPVVKRKRGRPRKVSLEEKQTIKKENQKEEQSKNVNKKPEKTINKTQKVSTKLEKTVNKTEEVDDKPEKVTNKAEKVTVPGKKQSKVSKKEEKHDELDDLEDDDLDFELEEDLESTNATNNKLENDNLDALEDDDLDDDFFDEEEENDEDDKDNIEDDDDLDLDEDDDDDADYDDLDFDETDEEDNDSDFNEDDDDYDDLDLDEDDDDYDNLDLDEDDDENDDLDSDEDEDDYDDLNSDSDEDKDDYDDLDSDEDEDDYDDLDLDEDDDENDDLDLDEDEDDYDDLDSDEDEDDYDDLDLDEDEDDYDDLDLDEDDDLDKDNKKEDENVDLNESNDEEDDEFDLDDDDYDDLDLDEDDDDLDLGKDNKKEDEDLDLDDDDLDLNDEKQEDEEDDDDYLDLDDEDDDLNWDEDDNNLNLDNQQDNNVNTAKNEEEEDDLNLDDDDDYLDLDDEEDNNLNSYTNNNNENEDFNIDDEDDDLNLDKYDDEDDNNEFTLDEDDDLDFQNTNTNNNSDDELSLDDDDVLNLDDDELKIDDNKNIGNTSNQFSGIRNKNYIPNYDISKQINEINGVSNNKTLNNNEEKDGNSVSVSIPEGKNIAAFVGAHGNGTSFIVNNLAQLLSEQGIKVAILDLTKNKNAYYIYTENEERLRGIAYSCFEKLKSGISDGIKVNKNLTVYTSLPNSDSELENKESAIKTLLNEFSLILLDCDLETDLEYFEIAQEIYLVQTLDVLTIQPLTSFMKKLKMNNKLNEEKLRVLINKDIKVNKLNEKILISAMSVYNSPDTTYQLDLFNRDKIGYLTIPFEERNYSKYLDELVECKLTIRGYSKSLINSFNKLAKIVYPMNNKKRK